MIQAAAPCGIPVRADAGKAETGRRDHVGRAHRDRLELCSTRVSFKGRENPPDRPDPGCCVPGRVHHGVLSAGSRPQHPDWSPVWRWRSGHGHGTAVAAPVAGDRDRDGLGVHLDIRVGADGAYSVRVPPGRYTVTGQSALYGNGTYLCQAAGMATVTSGHTTGRRPVPDGLTNPKINRRLPAQPTQTWPPGKARTVNGLASRHRTPRVGTTSARSSLGTL